MERPEFDITISSKGKLKVQIKGVKGKRCIELADLIRDIVGKEESRELTADYYEMDGAVRINTDVKARTRGNS